MMSSPPFPSIKSSPSPATIEFDTFEPINLSSLAEPIISSMLINISSPSPEAIPFVKSALIL